MQKKNSLAKRTDKNVIISNMAWSTNIPSNKVISIAAPADREADRWPAWVTLASWQSQTEGTKVLSNTGPLRFLNSCSYTVCNLYPYW